MRKLLFYFILLFTITNFLFLGHYVNAESIHESPLIITRVMVNPTSCLDSSCEFIEVRNVSQLEVNLENWSLNDVAFDTNLLIGPGKSITIARELIDDDDKDKDSYEAIWGNNSGVWGDDYNELYKVVEDSALGVSINLPNSSGTIKLSSDVYKEEFSWSKVKIGFIYDEDKNDLVAADSEEEMFQMKTNPVNILVNGEDIDGKNLIKLNAREVEVNLLKSTNTEANIFFDLAVSLENSLVIEKNDLTDRYSLSLDENGTYEFSLDLHDIEDNFSKQFTFTVRLNMLAPIEISELLPDPDKIDWNKDGEISDKSDEWLEFYNPNYESIELADFSLEDKTGNRHSLPRIEIAGNEYLIVYSKDIGITLNNADECVYLFDNSNVEIDELCYSKSKKDKSIVRVGDKVVISDPTPSRSNQGQTDSEDQEDMDDAKEEFENYKKHMIMDLFETEENVNVKVVGVVTSTTGLLGKNILYMKDSTGGLMVKSEQIVKEGDSIEVYGEKRIDSRGNIYLSAKKINVSGTSKPVMSFATPISKINHRQSGMLITVEGKISETSGKAFHIEDTSGEIKIYIKDSTNIKLPRKRVGDRIKVTGILSISKYDENSDSYEYVIYPRRANDVVIGSSKVRGKVLAATGSSIYMNILFSIILIMIALFLRLNSMEIKNS